MQYGNEQLIYINELKAKQSSQQSQSKHLINVIPFMTKTTHWIIMELLLIKSKMKKEKKRKRKIKEGLQLTFTFNFSYSLLNIV